MAATLSVVMLAASEQKVPGSDGPKEFRRKGPFQC